VLKYYASNQIYGKLLLPVDFPFQVIKLSHGAADASRLLASHGTLLAKDVE
jgi:hypothetical protein